MKNKYFTINCTALYSNVLHTVKLNMLTGTIEILDLTVRSAYARTQTES